MPIQDFTDKKIPSIKKDITKLISDARSCDATYKCTFIVNTDKKKEVLVKLLKANNIKVFEKISDPNTLVAEVE